MTAEQNWKKLGSYLRELRRHKRLSLRQAPEETGASGSHLSQVEQSKRHPSAHLLRKMAPTYGASVRDLLTLAGYLNEPEVNMSDRERIEWAFNGVVSVPAYQSGRGLAAFSALSLEAKSTTVEVYEKLTGRKL